MPRPTPDPVEPGQESVWDYPRPPRLERTERRIRIVHGGVVLVDTIGAYRVLETSHPPSYYLPPTDVQMAHLSPAEGTSFCEWKGSARYWTVEAGGDRMERIAWSYPRPSPDFRQIADYLAFYAAPFDEVTVDGERVIPQPGGFYGGWITSDVHGPFKGIPGSNGW